MFSLEQLLFAIANDQRTNDDTLIKMLPMMDEVFDAEKENRQAIKVRIFIKLIFSILLINSFIYLRMLA